MSEPKYDQDRRHVFITRSGPIPYTHDQTPTYSKKFVYECCFGTGNSWTRHHVYVTEADFPRAQELLDHWSVVGACVCCPHRHYRTVGEGQGVGR